MSKGLGKLQREIMEHLADVPDVVTNHPGEITVYECDLILKDGVYDLQYLRWRLAEIHGAIGYGGGIKKGFHAAFSRAVHSLIRRRILKPFPAFVPIKEVTFDDNANRLFRIHNLSDGKYFEWDSTNQVRFVRRWLDVRFPDE
jgi:hypothetical protein